MLPNFERMLQLVEESFATRNDPAQLDVNEDVMERLQNLHPTTLSERADKNGPIVWILVIPTTTDLMNKFIEHEITEQELFERTAPGISYDALYLCSALVLKEFRNTGFAKALVVDAVKKISSVHPIQTLFVWPFSLEGDKLAEKVAQLSGFPLMKRKKQMQ